jgi:transcriptional regulator with XRE-family HTH domain
MIDNRTVGRTIATLRQAKGMTQQQLAAAMNVSHQAVSKWETGAALPDIQTLLELTRLFGVTVEQLLCGGIPGKPMEDEKITAI